MSCYVIYYKDKSKHMREVLSAKEYMLLRDTREQQAIISEVRNGNGARKAQLLQCNYSCIPNADGTLKGSKRLSNSVGMDIDHLTKDDIKPLVAKITGMAEQLGLLMLEISARGEGMHVVFKRNPVLTQEGNLRWASDLIGVPFDENAKDITRVFFTTTSQDLLFLSDELFVSEEIENNAVDECVEVDGGFETADASEIKESKCDGFYNGVAISEIVSELENQLGGVPAHGSRNNFIFSMACHLRYICGASADAIATYLPNYGEAREKWMNSIKSACARSMPDEMPNVLKMAVTLAKGSTIFANGSANAENDDMPQMPKKLPALVELLVSKTPEIYKPAVATAIFPPLAAHLYDTRFTYIDNVEHEATLMCVLMAGTGAGKNCTAEPIRFIMEDINERDEISRERERAWKEEIQTRGANKDKRKRPEGIIIQNVKPDMTNAAFVQRTKEAEGRFLYSQMNEIDQFDALKTSGKSKAQFQIMCLAFDPNNSYGTERVGASSVSETVTIRFNWNASTTINKGKNYFSSVLTDGPISRINFCTIPEREIGADMPIYGKYDDAFRIALRPYIDNLVSASGNISCPQATALAMKMMNDNKTFAQLSQSRTYENLSFRANVIAYLKSMVLFVANGCKWDDTFNDFIEWSEKYDLWCKMRFFGEAIDNVNEKSDSKYTVRNLLSLLPDKFSMNELKNIRRARGVDKGDIKAMIRAWKNRGFIKQIDENSFEKIQ